eukprot:Tbor_TRINITY_DN2922_c0_g1::TRINITY_DN2922_c0_g1_i1::g.1118::m.1118/K14803/PTC2_3; protein phosphatase PTC2/3
MTNKKKNAAKNGKGNSKKDTEEFDAFLKELLLVTTEVGKTRQKNPASLTNEERRLMHQKQKEDAEKKKASELSAILEQRQRQRQFQGLIDQMMSVRSPWLSEPSTKFEFQQESSDLYEACVGAMQGWRSNMEDSHVIAPKFDEVSKTGLFAVFDGHGGSKCSTACQAVFEVAMKKQFKNGKIDFIAGYTELDNTLKEKLTDCSGSTAVAVSVNEKEIVCASVGDSRAVLCRKDGSTVSLSEDHKPENPEERARIEAAGGHVSDNRVNGELAMSRALGDFQYKEQTNIAVDKQLVTHIPDVVTVPREEGDEFIVIACDGIFDVMTNQQVVEFVRNELHSDETPSLSEICKKVCFHCLAPGSDGQPSRVVGTDNMTIQIVKFKS